MPTNCNTAIYNSALGHIGFASYQGPSSVAESTFALNSAYVYNTSGAAYATYFVAPESANLTDFYFKVSSFSGTWGSTDGVVNVEIREGMNGTNKPGSTLTGSFTVTLTAGTTGWYAKSGLSIALTAGKIYEAVIGDADGGATNFVTIVTKSGTSAMLPSIWHTSIQTSTNGFNTAGTNAAGAPSVVMKIGSTLIGGAYDATATTTSGTYERGMRFRPDNDCTLVGISWGVDQGNMFSLGATYKLYADATAPGGTTLMSWTAPITPYGGGTSPNPNMQPFPKANWYDLKGGTWYRFTVKPLAAGTTPRRTTINGSPQADVLAATHPFNGNAHWTNESGGAWDDTFTASISQFGPVIGFRNAGTRGYAIVG